MEEDRTSIAEIIIAQQIERDHWFMVEGHRQRVSVIREQIINPSSQTDEELGTRVRHPIFRQLFTILRQTWSDPQSRDNIFSFGVERDRDIEDSNCYTTCKNVKSTLDHVARVWEARNKQPFYSSPALVQT